MYVLIPYLNGTGDLVQGVEPGVRLVRIIFNKDFLSRQLPEVVLGSDCFFLAHR